MNLEEKDKYIEEHLMALSAETLRFMVADLVAKDKTDQLWCVHIQGMDDIIPFPSKNEADMEAAKINKSVGRQWKEGDPEINAVVVPWPGGPESHAHVLAEMLAESV